MSEEVKEIPWLEIEQDYMRGVAPKDLAVKYGIEDPELIYQKSRRNDWKQKRQEFAQKLKDSALDRAESILASLTEEADEVLAWLRNSRPDGGDAQNMRAWVGAWNSAWSKKLRSVGLPETISKVEQSGKVQLEEITFDITAAPGKETADEGEDQGEPSSETD